MNIPSAPRKWGRTILVTGHRRGGTTWLGRMLSLAQNSGYIFEPLTHTRHPRTAQVESLTRFNRATQRWILPWPAEGEEEAEHAQVVERQVEELFDIYFATRLDTLIIKHPGIEQFLFLRGVLQPDVSVYIKRHPVAILNSYHKSNLYHGWKIPQAFQRLRADIVRLRPDLSYMLSEVGSDQETQILCMCCIAHQLAEDWASEGKLIVIDYEDLARQGPAGAQQLFDRLGLQFSDDKLEQLNRLFSPTSTQSGFLDTEKDSKQRANAFTSELAPWQLSRARHYLERIGYGVPVPWQSSSERLRGTLEYLRREGKTLQNSARTVVSRMRARATGA